MLAELHADADFEQRSRRQTKLCHTSCWKLISFSLCKYQPTIAANRYLKSCLSICCLAPHHILQLFLFLPWFWPLPSATMLIVVSFSSTFHWAMEIKKKKTFLQWVTFTGKSWSIVIDAWRSILLVLRHPIPDKFNKRTFCRFTHYRLLKGKVA